MQIISINFEGKSYKLAYPRKSVEILSRQGFKLEDINAYPMIAIPQLFHGAFLEYHPRLRKADTDRIWAAQTRKAELVGVLVEMYAAPLNALLDSDAGEDNGDEKNATWTVTEA